MTRHEPFPTERPRHLSLDCCGRLSLPPGFRYVLALRKDQLGQSLKPMAFASLDAMVGHIHRARANAGLQLADQPLLLAGRDAVDHGVAVWILDPATGDRCRYLGWAWIDGASRLTLEAALYAQPSGRVH